MTQKTRKVLHDFRGHHLIPAAASGAGFPFVKTDTSAAGSPTVAGASGGGVALTFDATAEVQNLCLSMGDVLPYDIDDLIRVEFLAKVSGTLDATTMLAFGVASARNDTLDTVAQSAWFRCEGNNNVLCESDDGVTDRDDIAAGVTIGTTLKRFCIDFASGILSRDPPSVSLGGKGNVQFFAANGYGSLRRVASGTLFDMSGYAGNLQILAQIQKTANANVNSLTIASIEVEYKLPAA